MLVIQLANLSHTVWSFLARSRGEREAVLSLPSAKVDVGSVVETSFLGTKANLVNDLIELVALREGTVKASRLGAKRPATTSKESFMIQISF